MYAYVSFAALGDVSRRTGGGDVMRSWGASAGASRVSADDAWKKPKGGAGSVDAALAWAFPVARGDCDQSEMAKGSHYIQCISHSKKINTHLVPAADAACSIFS